MIISTIIPVYNGERYLDEAIQSALNQKNVAPTEIIVIDDGSTDSTAEIAQSYENITYYYQSNRGVAAARNLGASKAKGTYLAFLDADDKWHPDKLQKQLSAILNTDSDCIFSFVQHFKCPKYGSSHTHSAEPLPGIFSLTLFIKKSSFELTDGFPEKLAVGEFIDWYSSAQALGLKSHTIKDVLAYRRIHQNNMTIQNKKKFNNYATVLKQHLNRKRQTCDI